MRNQPIERIMTTPAVVITPTATLNDACELMARENLHHLPVVENGRLVGIVSTTDLIARSGGNEPDVGRIRIAEVMHRDPISLSRKATLDDAAVLLAGGRYHSLPVTDADGTVVGVVTSTDLIVVLLHQLPASDKAGAGEHHAPAAVLDEFATDPAALEACINEAERRLRSGGDADRLVHALVYLAGKSRDLENVRRAADVYLRSGHGEHEHTALVRALERAREHLGPSLRGAGF
jgi:CBS domain-containing protein